MTSVDLEKYQAWLRGRLDELAPVFAKAAIGDFSSHVVIPEKEDELTEFFVGVQIMLDTIREKVKQLENSLDQVNAANEIIASEKARVEAILDGLGEGLLIVDGTGHVTYANEPAIALFGEHSRVLGQDVAAVAALEDADEKLLPSTHHPIRMAITHQRRTKFNLTKGAAYYLRMANGQRRRLGLTITPIYSPGSKGAGAAVVLHDITDESNMDRAKSEIVSIASHQLRTPLTAIRWYVKALMDDEHRLNQEQRERYLKQIHDANSHMVDLVDALLNVSRIDLGTLNLKPQAVQLNKALKAVLKELAVEIEAKQLKITVQENAHLLPLFIDPNSLHIILQNLVSNAVKYSPKGKEVTIAVQQQASSAVVEVRDQGAGIPVAEQTRIFSKLFRASNAQAVAPDGSGLGLYVTKAMIEQAGGKISFESTPNHGSVFYVIIPSKVD
jgi:two-component system, OmpR family, phosphate regulon sensor histidine kinase PhoR